jgi:hypothetical protein
MSSLPIDYTNLEITYFELIVRFRTFSEVYYFLGVSGTLYVCAAEEGRVPPKYATAE